MLESIKAILEEEGVDSYLEKNEMESSDTLMIPVMVSESDDEPLMIQTLHLTLDEELTSGSNIFHHICFYPYELNELEDVVMERLDYLLHSLNPYTPLGSFGINLDEGLLYYKYATIIPMENEEMSSELIIDIYDLITFLLQVYSDAFKDVVENNRDPNEILAEWGYFQE